MKLNINPEKIKAFKGPQKKHFYFVTNKEFVDMFELQDNDGFLSNNVLMLSVDTSFEDLLENSIPEDSCVLVVSPNVFFSSPLQDKIGSRRIIAMACNSTPTHIEDIHHFWDCLINTDPLEQQQRTDVFFELGENSEYLKFIDNTNKTSAIFNHLDESYLWSEQTGLLNDGEQQLAPSGEISVLPIAIQEFNEDLRLDFTGSIAFHGAPILHSGTPSFTRKDQKRIYNDLSVLNDNAVLAELKSGVIEEIFATNGESQKAVDMLNCMFKIDSRYRILWEIGFGINSAIKIREGNHAMNETYGGKNGCIHFGLGLTPYTQYHLDIVCPSMTVLTSDDQLLIGTKSRKMRSIRNSSTNCLCAEN